MFRLSWGLQQLQEEGRAGRESRYLMGTPSVTLRETVRFAFAQIKTRVIFV